MLSWHRVTVLGPGIPLYRTMCSNGGAMARKRSQITTSLLSARPWEWEQVVADSSTLLFPRGRLFLEAVV